MGWYFEYYPQQLYRINPHLFQSDNAKWPHRINRSYMYLQYYVFLHMRITNAFNYILLWYGRLNVVHFLYQFFLKSEFLKARFQKSNIYICFSRITSHIQSIIFIQRRMYASFIKIISSVIGKKNQQITEENYAQHRDKIQITFMNMNVRSTFSCSRVFYKQAFIQE